MGLGEELAEEARVVVPTRIHPEDVTHDRSTLPPPELRYRRSANVITEDSRHQRHPAAVTRSLASIPVT